MRPIARGWCALGLAVSALPAMAQGATQGQVPAWAVERTREWSISHYDAQGHPQWTGKQWHQVSSGGQLVEARARLGNSRGRRAALWALTAWPLDQWEAAALKTGGPEVAQFLYRRRYRQGGTDPFAYLGSAEKVDRPWAYGLGLHLDKGGWRFQWLPSPALFTQSGTTALPKALEEAAQPGLLIHLKQLRPGLEKLVALAGGTAADPDGAATGILPALARGSRVGFSVRHLEPWLKQVSPALEPLTKREVWVLHYGADREGGRSTLGTLVFSLGDLPARSQLLMALLKLNPLNAGARSRVVTWSALGTSTEVQQLRGSGCVLHLIQRAEGTWISDRETPLRALLFPGADLSLAERQEWARVALSALRPDSELAFWVVPRIGATAAFENQALRRPLAHAQQGSWANPFVARAAPCTGAMALALALGAGPTEKRVEAILPVDDANDFKLPQMPEFANGGQALSPAQMKALAQAQERQRQPTSLRQDTAALQACPDLRGAALFWNGWVSAPPQNAAEKTALTELGRLRREDPWRALQAQRDGKVTAFGGFGKPGITPSLALALPVQVAKRLQLENLLSIQTNGEYASGNLQVLEPDGAVAEGGRRTASGGMLRWSSEYTHPTSWNVHLEVDLGLAGRQAHPREGGNRAGRWHGSGAPLDLGTPHPSGRRPCYVRNI